MKLTLHIWRQKSSGEPGKMVPYSVEANEHMYFPVGISQNGHAKRHLFNNAFQISDTNALSNTVLIAKENKETRKDVLDETLSAKADGQSRDPRACQKGLEAVFVTQLEQHHKHNADAQHCSAKTANEMAQRFRPVVDPMEVVRIQWTEHEKVWGPA